jgi:L-threonylcarbamoyladenylate synthase
MPLHPAPANDANIATAAEFLQAGRLVAFPTETVYGLGADARNGEAVAGIFAAKGRPTFNPLIIHVASTEDAGRWAILNPMAIRLAAAFWPGGLTMVLDRHPTEPGDAPSWHLSDLVSAGLPSIAIRVPSHPVAQKLLRAAGCPVAAPSANRSGHVSATSAAHVVADFSVALPGAPDLAMILDDGPCHLGIESTIVDARSGTLTLLRPGAIPLEALADIAGTTINEPMLRMETSRKARTSPGQLESHYAPSKRVCLNVTEPKPDQALLAFGPLPGPHTGPLYNLSTTGDLLEAAANLFEGLRQLDATQADTIAVMPIPQNGLGHAINDRLQRAAAPRI